jgi:hypothetical protein
MRLVRSWTEAMKSHAVAEAMVCSKSCLPLFLDRQRAIEVAVHSGTRRPVPFFLDLFNGR